jgi:hypothetical protein
MWDIPLNQPTPMFGRPQVSHLADVFGLLARPAKGFAALTGMASPDVAPWLQNSIIPPKYNYPYGTPAKEIEADRDAKMGEQFLGMGGTMKVGKLAMDTASRMARAKEQGYHVNETLYHGTSYDFPAFSGKRGTWLAEDPSIADIYANLNPSRRWSTGAPPTDAGPNILPVHIRGRVLEVTDRGPDGGQGWSSDNIAKQLGVDISKIPHVGQIPKVLNEEALKQGYTAIKIKDMSDLGSQSQTQVRVLDPKFIRSRHAEFDPAKSDSPDLLAGMIPLAPMFGRRPEDR